MIVTFSPVRMDGALDLARRGDSLIVNGAEVDLSGPDAADSPWIEGRPDRREGVWHVTVVLPIAEDAPGPARFPAPVEQAADGPVPLPG